MFSHRQDEILKILVKNSNQINIKSVSNRLNTTEKTIRTDIKKLNILLEAFESSIDINNNIITLDTYYNSVHWLNVLKLNKDINEVDRIKLFLITQTSYMNLYELSEELYISKPKLEKILKNIDFRYLHINRVRNKGILAEGTYLNKANELIYILKKYIDVVNYLVSTRLMMKKIFKKEMNIKDFKNMINIHQDFILKENIKNDELIIEIFIIQLFSFYYKDGENLSKVYMDYLRSVEQDKENIVKVILESHLNENNIKYDKNSEIFRMFVAHIVLTLSGIRSNKSLESSDIESIKKRFKNMHELSSAIIDRFNLEGLQIKNEEEKYYFTIYLQTLNNQIPRINKKSIYVICHYGMSFSAYITDKLKKYIDKDIEIYTFSVYEYMNNIKELKNSSNEHIIVTTIENLDVKNKILINPMPKDTELFELVEKIKLQL